MNITKCCLIGFDEYCNLEKLFGLQTRTRIPLEFGVLYSPKRSGNDNRYPSLKFIKHISEKYDNKNIAIHLCGDAVKNYFANDYVTGKLCEGYKRIQLNFSISKHDNLSTIIELLDNRINISHVPLILQYNESKRELVNSLIQIFKNDNNVNALKKLHVLFDTSGGLGKVADSYMPVFENITCGYAGGINPDTLTAVLANIYNVNGETPFYIDMESGIRTNDKFSIEKCKQIIETLNNVTERCLIHCQTGNTI